MRLGGGGWRWLEVGGAGWSWVEDLFKKQLYVH